MAWFSYGLCLVGITLTLAQAVWRWHGLRSAASLTVGLVGGTALTVRAAQLKRSGSRGFYDLEQVSNTLGSLAVIPTLVLVGVPHPGPVLGVTQALADGFIAGQFGVLVFLIQRPDAGRP